MRGLLRRLDPVALVVDRARRDLRQRAGLRDRTVALADGRHVAALDTLGDRPAAVLLHGIGASKDHWPRLTRRLAPRLRVVAPDLPGYGESDVAGDLSTSGLADAVVQFLDALGLDRVHLAGAAMGGRIAALVAARHPDRLRTLWLLAPAGAEGERASEMIEGLFAGRGVPLFARTAAEYAASLAFTMSRPPAIPRPALRVLAAEGAAVYDHNRRRFAALSEELALGPSTEDVLRDVAVPTLVTWGAEDRVLHPSGAATVAAAMPNATAHVLDGVGHLPMLEVPEQLAADYLAFLDGWSEAPLSSESGSRSRTQT